MWVLAVDRLTCSAAAISVLDRPRPIRVSTSEAAGARPQGGEDVLVEIEGGQDQHPDGRSLRGGGDPAASSLGFRDQQSRTLDGVLEMTHQSASPEAVYIIRHGEKPQDLAPRHPAAHSGVDFRGNQNEHSLLPRGWQRSGALAALFDPTHSPLQAGLRVPRMLISPSYGHASKTADHRTHQTIRGLSDRLGVEITADFAKGQEPQLAAAVLNSGTDAVLICWEHGHIPVLASALPLVSGTIIPKSWPDDRYDVIWTFTLTADATYAFGQVPQLLLSGDADTVIA
jgi:hypothetical protein